MIQRPSTTLATGLNLVLERDALHCTDDTRLHHIAAAFAAFAAEYGIAIWNFQIHDGAFAHQDGASRANAYELHPTTAFGFGTGDVFSQTRWQFVNR